MSSVAIIDPSGNAPSPTNLAGASRPAALTDKRVGMLDNGKPNADHVVGQLGRQLHHRFHAGVPVAAGKAVASQPCPDEVLVGFQGFDVAIVGVGD